MDEQDFHNIPANYRSGDIDDRLQYAPNQKSLEYLKSKQAQKPMNASGRNWYDLQKYVCKRDISQIMMILLGYLIAACC